MEILASLSPHPTRLADLMHDFHLSSQSELREYLDGLVKTEDIELDLKGDESSRCVRVKESSWARAQKLASEYLSNTNNC